MPSKPPGFTAAELHFILEANKAAAKQKPDAAYHPAVVVEAGRILLQHDDRLTALGVPTARVLPSDGPVAAPSREPSDTQVQNESPWWVAKPGDPPPEQPWYTPARYFARQLVVADSTLLVKRMVLADKVSMSLKNAGIYKRGGRKAHSAETILKAFANVSLG